VVAGFSVTGWQIECRPKKHNIFTWEWIKVEEKNVDSTKYQGLIS
jgi:hypothetical protein